LGPIAREGTSVERVHPGLGEYAVEQRWPRASRHVTIRDSSLERGRTAMAAQAERNLRHRQHRRSRCAMATMAGHAASGHLSDVDVGVDHGARPSGESEQHQRRCCDQRKA